MAHTCPGKHPFRRSCPRCDNRPLPNGHDLLVVSCTCGSEFCMGCGKLGVCPDCGARPGGGFIVFTKADLRAGVEGLRAAAKTGRGATMEEVKREIDRRRTS